MPGQAYSIHYQDENGRVLAADWSYWGYHGQWSRSRCHPIRWEPLDPGLDEESYAAILKHFGLEDEADRLTIEVVTIMGPSALAMERRELERVKGLPRLEIKSETVGYNGPADDHVD